MKILGSDSLEHAEGEGSICGLGNIPCMIEWFHSENGKAAFHIWGGILHEASPTVIDIGNDESCYFVYCYRTAYEHNDPLGEWVYTTTQYCREVFVSSIQQGNIFATQFHPEKSGPSGLRLLAAWLRAPEHCHAPVAPFVPRIPVPRAPQPKDGPAKRIIACLDVRANDEGDLVATKGDQYDVRDHDDGQRGRGRRRVQPGQARAPRGALLCAGRRRDLPAEHNVVPRVAARGPADARGRVCRRRRGVNAPHRRRQDSGHRGPGRDAPRCPRGRRGVLLRARGQR